MECFRGIYQDRDIRGVADLDLAALFEPIESLVDRRNEISHGIINIDDIESVDLLTARCLFLMSYVHALYVVTVQELLKHMAARTKMRLCGKPVAVFNHCIVCLEIANQEVAEGDILVAATQDSLEPFRFGRIERLEVDKVATKRVVATDPVKFGAQVSFHASEHHEYYLLTDDGL
jgi:hypothetical protein